MHFYKELFFTEVLLNLRGTQPWLQTAQAENMATSNHPPVFSLNQIINFKGKTCLITNIFKVLGFHQYEVVDIDTGHRMRAMGYQMAPSEEVSAALLPEFQMMEEEIEIPAEPSSSTITTTESDNVNTDTVNSARWAKMTEIELNALAENRHSQYTANQTRWAAKAFKGMFLTYLHD